MMTTAPRRSSSPSPATRNPREVVAAVRPIAERLASEHGLVVWGLDFHRHAGREMLRVSCDRVGGITSEEVATYAEQLSRELDRIDVVPGEARYTLEVGSPGAERKLEDPDQFRVCVGRVARLSLRDGRTVEGTISGVSEHAVELDVDDEGVRALFDDITRARLVVKL